MSAPSRPSIARQKTPRPSPDQASQPGATPASLSSDLAALVQVIQRTAGNQAVNRLIQRYGAQPTEWLRRAGGPGSVAPAARPITNAPGTRLQRQDDDEDDAGAPTDSQQGSGTVTIPEVTIVGNPNDGGDDGQQPTGQPAGDGTVTIPEVTIVGDPNTADSSSPDGTDGSPAAAGVAGALLGATGAPGAEPIPPEGMPGGPVDMPPIPGETPINPNFGAPGTYAPPNVAPGAAPSVAPEVAAEGAEVAPEVAAGAGLGAAGVGVAAAGFGVGLVGPFAVGYAVEHSEELNQQADPDEVSPPGGAPPQSEAGADGGAGPVQLPSGQPSTPAVDPDTGQPVSDPTDPNAAPATDPSAPGTAQLPGQPDNGPAQAAGSTSIVQGPPPPGPTAIANKIPSATPGAPVQIGTVTKQTVVIDGQTYVGGDTFKNLGTPLPAQTPAGGAITYQEYDVNPYQPGVNRGSERVVVGSDGHMYYTNDHYNTFFVVR